MVPCISRLTDLFELFELCGCTFGTVGTFNSVNTVNTFCVLQQQRDRRREFGGHGVGENDARVHGDRHDF